MPERSAVCPALMLTTLQPVAEGGWDHDHGCKLTPGHDDLHECFKCGAKWLSKTARNDGRVDAD